MEKMTKENELYNSRISVPQNFEGIFSHFYFAENQTSETITKTLLPSYQTILIFNFGKKVTLRSSQNTQIEIKKTLMLGTIKKAFDYTLPPQSKILVANFKDDAFFRFFGIASLAENSGINPDELVDENCFTALWYSLNKMDNVNRQVDYILEFCKPYLRDRNPVAEQLKKINARSLNPIKVIAKNNQQTERSIQINYKKHFGFSAKEINRFQRFLKAIKHIENIASNALKVDWFIIINECGYYDQSQLINDFKHYLNLSPTKYMKFQQDICNPLH